MSSEEEGPESERVASTDDAPFALSEQDEIIRRLNHQGISNRYMSKILWTDYGIKLSESSVRHHLLEMAQDPANNIRVNFKATYIKPREQRRWYNIVLELQKMIPAYTKRMGYKPSVRTMFYELQDLKLLKSDEESSYNTAVTHARLQYMSFDGQLEFPILPLDCFAADRSRLSIDNYDDSPPKEMIAPGDIPDHEEITQDAIDELKDAIEDFDGVGEYGEDAKPGGYWYGQPKYVEVWEEKNDLLDGFDKILKKRYIKVRANKGWSSLDYLNQCTIELKALIEKKRLKQESVVVGYCGDCDPSGLKMIYYIKKRLRQLGIPNVRVDHIGVKPEHIVKYNLPKMSLERRAGATRDDPNLEEFKRLHGDNATHLNAFFTPMHIKDFKKILLDWVDSHHDKKIYRNMVKKYSDVAADPPRLTPRQLRAARAEMWQMVRNEFCSDTGEGDNNDNDNDSNDNNSSEEGDNAASH